MKSLRYKSRSGQTALEYVIVFVVLLGVIEVLRVFVSSARSSARMLSIRPIGAPPSW